MPLLFLLLAQIPMIGLRRHLARRARRPQGAKSLRYDDHLGEGALPDFVRETFRRHHNLIATNLPGTPDRFTLTIVDNPPRKRILSRENPSEFLAYTDRLVSLRGRRLARTRGFPIQPIVAVVRNNWPRMPSGVPSSNDLEWSMTATLFHEICHVFGYSHGRYMKRLESPFKPLLYGRVGAPIA